MIFLQIINDLFQWFLLAILVGGVLFWIFPPLGLAMFGLCIICGFIATIINSGVLALMLNIVLIVTAISLLVGIILAFTGRKIKIPNPLRVIVSTVALAFMQLVLVNIANTGLDKIVFKGPAKFIETYTVYLNHPDITDGQIIKIMLLSSLGIMVAYEVITFVVSMVGAAGKRDKKE